VIALTLIRQKDFVDAAEQDVVRALEPEAAPPEMDLAA
jgi:hypothetical protein